MVMHFYCLHMTTHIHTASLGNEKCVNELPVMEEKCEGESEGVSGVNDPANL